MMEALMPLYIIASMFHSTKAGRGPKIMMVELACLFRKLVMGF